MQQPPLVQIRPRAEAGTEMLGFNPSTPKIPMSNIPCSIPCPLNVSVNKNCVLVAEILRS